MTSAVNPEFKFTNSADLKTQRFDKRAVDGIKDALTVDQWKTLAQGELEVYRQELKDDVSVDALQNTPKCFFQSITLLLVGRS